MDVEAFLAELAALAEADERPVETRRYGKHPDQVGDLRLPDRAPRGLVVVIHGGFWRAAYTRAGTAALACDLAARGFATWNVEYRRVGAGGGIPETLEDVEASLGAVEELGPPLAIGHSAGGHLALWLAGTGRIARAVSLAGVADLTGAAEAGLGGGAALELAGGTPAERPDAYELADPLLRLPLRVPALLVHGDRDDRVPIEQSRRYVAAAGERAQLLELPGVGHFEPIDPRSDAWAAVVARLERRR